MGEEKIVDKLCGKYGIYIIKKYTDYGIIFSDEYYKIYKDGEMWKTASSAEYAYKIIKDYDSAVKSCC